MKLTELLALIVQETTIKPEWEQPEYLSELLLRLGSYYSLLGDFISSAEHDRDELELSYKVSQADAEAQSIKDGAKIGLAEREGLVASKVARERHLLLKHKAKRLSLARESLDKTMTAIDRKLSYIKFDRSDRRPV